MQPETIGLVYCLQHADDQKKEVLGMRAKSDTQFQSFFPNEVDICETAGFSIHIGIFSILTKSVKTQSLWIVN